MKTIEQLTDAHEAAAQELIEAVKEAYPVGAIVELRLHGKEVWIRAKVEGYCGSSRYPHELRVRNVKTGKTRNVSAHPFYGNRVELVSLPENDQAQIPRTQDVADTTDSPERLSAAPCSTL